MARAKFKGSEHEVNCIFWYRFPCKDCGAKDLALDSMDYCLDCLRAHTTSLRFCGNGYPESPLADRQYNGYMVEDGYPPS